MAENKGSKANGKKKLVIVESPTKVDSVKKYLGSGYIIEATMGHVRDLPKSQLGVYRISTRRHNNVMTI